VGYELYCSLLQQAVRQLRRLPPKASVDVDVDLPVEAYIPRSYVPDMRLKIDLYRRLARVACQAELDDFTVELSDRFGAVPTPVERLLVLSKVRIAAHQWRIRSIRMENEYVVFLYTSATHIRQLADASRGRLRVVDGQSAYLPLGKEVMQSDEILRQVESLLQPK